MAPRGALGQLPLPYFIVAAETVSFGRAAKRCSVSQPSLSRQIIELGEKPFDRSVRAVRARISNDIIDNQSII